MEEERNSVPDHDHNHNYDGYQMMREIDQITDIIAGLNARRLSLLQSLSRSTRTVETPAVANSVHSMRLTDNAASASAMEQTTPYFPSSSSSSSSNSLYNSTSSAASASASINHNSQYYNNYNNNGLHNIYEHASASGSASLVESLSPQVHDHRGIVSYLARAARDPNRCRFLQDKLDEGDPRDLHVIFTGVRESLCSLMVHRVGYHLVHKMIALATKQKRLDIIHDILVMSTVDIRRFRHICSDDFGTRVMQQLVTNLKNREQQWLMASALTRMAPLTLTKSTNCDEVIKRCLDEFDAIVNEPFLVGIAAKNAILEMATDKKGCCILQSCLKNVKSLILIANDSTNGRDFISVANAQQVFNSFVDDIIKNVEFLSLHGFGNYVVQYVIQNMSDETNQKIVARLRGKFVSLSIHAHSSHVVQTILEYSTQANANKITYEIIKSPQALTVFQDAFGNFVSQTAFDISNGPVHDEFIELITRFSNELKSHPYGKKVHKKISPKT